MTLNVAIGNPKHPESLTALDAEVDASVPIASVPAELAECLGLPFIDEGQAYAFVEFGGRSIITSVRVIDRARQVVLGHSTLTGLFLRVNRHTGLIDVFEPTLL